MTLRIAVTRATPDAEATAARIRERGHVPVVTPLLTIVPCGYDTNVDGAQALIFTSANGVRAFPAVREAQDTLVLAVGDATAQAANIAGFRDVRSADGDVAALQDLARAALSPDAGKIIHIAGNDVAGDFSSALAAAGYSVERRTAYAAVPARQAPPGLFAPIDVVLFHSARAAEAYISFGAPQAARRTAACMSARVAESAAKTSWARLIVAPRPREDCLLDTALAE